MHAGKIARSDAATFAPPARNTLAERLQGKKQFPNPGGSSPLLTRRMGSASAAVLQEKRRQMQAKEQEHPHPASALSGPATSVPGKYAPLVGDTSHVKVYKGPHVDAALQPNGLQGLSNGNGEMAVASYAEPSTFAHELIHSLPLQPRVTEGNRKPLEDHADKEAEKVEKGIRAEPFEGGSLQAKGSGGLQAKCKQCEGKKKGKHQFKENDIDDSDKIRRGNRGHPTPPGLSRAIREAWVEVSKYAAINSLAMAYANFCYLSLVGHNLIQLVTLSNATAGLCGRAASSGQWGITNAALCAFASTVVLTAADHIGGFIDCVAEAMRFKDNLYKLVEDGRITEEDWSTIQDMERQIRELF